ncbi:tail fiber protein [Escherichia phage vB_EcoM_APEC]|nr:tail fiber protein [Escherichia phage vB_EcoM_APEC]
MSVPNQIPESNYVGNGTTTTFAANFEYASDSDVFVTVNGVAPEIGQAVFANGVFTFITAPANGTAVRVYRSTPIERDTEYDNHDNVFRPRVVNIDFDRVWFVLQEYLLSLGITNARITQEIADRIQADAEMMNYILNEDNELKADYILRDENLKTDYIYRDENLKKYVDQTLGALLNLPDFQGIEAQFVKDVSGKNQQEINNALAGVGEKVKREFVSVWDFFTTSEYATYKASPTAFDASRPVQEFFNYIVANDTRVAYCSGDFVTSQDLLLGSGSAKTKLLFGNASFKALNAIDTVLNINAGSDFEWVGMITTTGTGSTGSNSYNSRTCRVGVQISSPGKASPRNKYTAITANNFKEFGVFANGVASLSSLGFIRSSNCGSGKKTAGYSLTSNFSNATNSGSSGSVSQLTTLDVDTLPSSDLASANTNTLPLQAIINGTPYYIQSIDRVNNKITIFPWIEPSITSGTLTYMFGGAVCVNGRDSSVLGIEMIDAVNCGAALVSGALYPPVVERIVSQVNGAALVLGQNPASAMIGGSVGTLYCENNDFDLIRVTRSKLSFNILNTVAFNMNKVGFACATRSTSGSYSAFAHLKGINIFENGVPVQYQRSSASLPSQATCDVTDPNNSDFIFNGGATASTITLGTPNDNYANLFGIYKKRVIVYGTGPNNRPSTVNFTVADTANYTINAAGTTTTSYSGFDGFAVFDIIYRSDTKRFLISQVSNRDRAASVTYNPPSLTASGTAGDFVSTTVNLTGATVGTPVHAAFTQYNADIEISAQVSAENTVTVKFKNTSAAAVDLSSGTLTVKLI